VIAGFLGSGKTTFVESVLKAPFLAKQVAVIQNEFSAEMGVESSLMKDGDGNDIEDFYEMPNGCICCAAKDDLIQTLDSLLEKTKRKIEYILVETNGLADPCQVVQSFWLDEQLCSKV
jgi:G3E family GTPase